MMLAKHERYESCKMMLLPHTLAGMKRNPSPPVASGLRHQPDPIENFDEEIV